MTKLFEAGITDALTGIRRATDHTDDIAVVRLLHEAAIGLAGARKTHLENRERLSEKIADIKKLTRGDDPKREDPT